MLSKIIAKLESLTPTQKLIILAVIVTFIASCGIITFFILANPGSPSVISSSSTGSTSDPNPTLEISDDSSSSSTTPSETSHATSSSDRPQLMDTPPETNPSSNQSSDSSSGNQSTAQKPAPATPQPTAPAPTKTPEEADPICGGKYAISASCITQKMYGTTYPGKNHPFAYDVANYYSLGFQNAYASGRLPQEVYLNGADSTGALAMISKDLRRDETDQVSVHFYAYKSNDTWTVNWKIYVSKKIGDKSYSVYSQFGKDRLSQAERDAITNRYIPEYTKEFNETIALYERNYLPWYNSQR